LIAEALIDAAEAVGLDRSQADVLVRQLFVGSAALLARGDDPAQLRASVTSPGGTTAAGIAALEAASVREAIRAAVEAATARSRELGQQK
jgi:pyrroline-5-carboxylate reductase